MKNRLFTAAYVFYFCFAFYFMGKAYLGFAANKALSVGTC